MMWDSSWGLWWNLRWGGNENENGDEDEDGDGNSGVFVMRMMCDVCNVNASAFEVPHYDYAYDMVNVVAVPLH